MNNGNYKDRNELEANYQQQTLGSAKFEKVPDDI